MENDEIYEGPEGEYSEPLDAATSPSGQDSATPATGAYDETLTHAGKDK